MRSSELGGKEFNGYLRRRIPHELDSVVQEFVRAFRSASSQGRQELISGLTARAAGALSSFGERMAAVAVRTRSAEHLRLGLVAMGIAEGRLEDPRTNLMVLATVNHSAAEIGSSLSSLIGEVELDLSPEALATFRSFERRSDRDKSLIAMGLTTTGLGEDFRYVSG